MGLEATCDARWGRRRSSGQARLEATELVFRGDFRLRIPFAAMTAVAAEAGGLEIRFPEGTVRLELGAAAEKWALRIRYPRGLMDKLGVKAGARISVVGVDDDAFWTELGARGADVARGRLRAASDMIVWAAQAPADLGRLRALRASIKPGGAIWVVWPKGRKTLREDDVRAAALKAGLVDVKVVSVSDTLSGLKLMIPVSRR